MRQAKRGELYTKCSTGIYNRSKKVWVMAAAHILQVAYYQSLMEARRMMLENLGYDVTCAFGNDQAKVLVSSKTFDVIVVGFSAKYSLRSQIVRWLKQFAPRTPVVVLLANEAERLTESDCATLSVDPATCL